jgi:hypothetical protein
LLLARTAANLSEEIAKTQTLIGRSLAASSLVWDDHTNIQDAEFKVFSQFGDDGIIQYLVRKTSVTDGERVFVEFGTENYIESNTRFLLVNNNWRGLILDGSRSNMEFVRRGELYWRFDLTAVTAFIDAENINSLISDAGFVGDIGLLSIDIDGNDYWVWKAISCVEPVIVVAEYNGVFGADRPVTIPYSPTFVRSKAHYSHLYWGASLGALAILADAKGYDLVGCNSAGNNAYFVRRDRLNGQPELSVADAFVAPRFRESRDRRGRLNFLAGESRLRNISDQTVYDVAMNELIPLSDLLGGSDVGVKMKGQE